jgi:hypothetical protein
MKRSTLRSRLATAGLFVGAALTFLFAPSAGAQASTLLNLQTNYAQITLDSNGFVSSFQSRPTGKEYAVSGHLSSLLSLHEYGQPYTTLVLPTSASLASNGQQIVLNYPNGAVATINVAAMSTYFRFQLVSLASRGSVDNIVWGPLHTSISKTIGDVIGVVRNDDYAIGMWGLDDNTIAGPPSDSDSYALRYYIHSSDPINNPVPAPYYEGEEFGIGGNGSSDVAFYSHPEPYFHLYAGSGAMLEPSFGSTVTYHSRDRTRSYTYFYSLIPDFTNNRARHQVSDPLQGVDFIGSAAAFYGCPDDLGLSTIESIILGENLPHLTYNGKWIRDPATNQPGLSWSGPFDNAIQYATSMGLKHLSSTSNDDGEFYPSIDRSHGSVTNGAVWQGSVTYNNASMSYKNFAALAKQQGIGFGGLHTLSLFLQGGISGDVTPVPSPHLQTVLRTHLVNGISATDTNIVVDDPSFLAEVGTWPEGDNSNYLQIGGEMLRYSGITTSAPYTLQGVVRGHASTAAAHNAGDELVKLQQDAYNGFTADMTLMLDYADYYAYLMAQNGMEQIGFDGLESTLYQNQGYYGVRTFLRRFFNTYSQLTGATSFRVWPSAVFTGGWEYMNAAPLGGGPNLFNPVANQWITEGKDLRDGYDASYYPPTMGGQHFDPTWSLYDVENLEAKSLGWNAAYNLYVSQAGLDQYGDRDALFAAFHAWEDARAASYFTKAQKALLQDTSLKFDLVENGPNNFTLTSITEVNNSGSAGTTATSVAITNNFYAQPLNVALKVNAAVPGFTLVLPDGKQLTSSQALASGQYVIVRGNAAYTADQYRKKIADLTLSGTATLPAGASQFSVQFTASGSIPFNLTTWIGHIDPENYPLAAYWKLDDASGTSAADASGLVNTGTVYGGATWVSGVTGGALSLNGTNAYAATSKVVSTQIDNITMSAWVKWNGATSDHQVILNNGSTATSGYSIFLDHGNGNKLSLLAGGIAVMSSQTTLPVGQWALITATRSAGTWNLYVNGAAVAITNGGTTPHVPAGTTTIGAAQGGIQNFNGSVDDVRLYNGALSSNSVIALYHEVPTPVAYWKLDETSGTSAADSSGNNNTGTVYGTANWVSGEIGGALSLNGTNAYVQALSLASTQTDNITMSAWVKWNGSTSDHQVILNNGSTATSGYAVFLDHGNSNKLSLLAGGVAVMSSQTTLATGQWTMVTATRSGGIWSLYVNGASVAITGSATTPRVPAGVTTIGAAQGGIQDFNGTVDDARFYNSALGSSSVQNLYRYPGAMN